MPTRALRRRAHHTAPLTARPQRCPQPGGAGPRPGVEGLRQHTGVSGGSGGGWGSAGRRPYQLLGGAALPLAAAAAAAQPGPAPRHLPPPAPPRPAHVTPRAGPAPATWPRPIACPATYRAWPRPHSTAAARIGLACTWPRSHNRPNRAPARTAPPGRAPGPCRRCSRRPAGPARSGRAPEASPGPAPRRHVG